MNAKGIRIMNSSPSLNQAYRYNCGEKEGNEKPLPKVVNGLIDGTLKTRSVNGPFTDGEYRGWILGALVTKWRAGIA